VSADTGQCYTAISEGIPYAKLNFGPDIIFDVDKDGVILGAHTQGAADWVNALVQLVQAGKVRALLQ
jgi:uncharacterized protein YuzE